MSRRVVVTGLGCITPLGNSLAESWTNLLAGRSGIMPVTQLNNYQADYEPFINSIPKTLGVGKITKPFQKRQLDLFTSQDQRRLSSFTKLAILATQEALANANLLQDDMKSIQSGIDLTRFGCVIGSGIASIDEIYATSIEFHNQHKKVNPLFVPKILTNMAAGNVSIRYGLKGLSHSVSVACATGNSSIGDAYNFIRLGMADICVSGASESSVHPLALAGFARSKSITTDGISRPFDISRSGFVLGEGAGIAILESLEHAKRRNAHILCEVGGYGISSDAYHITSPAEDADGASRAIEMALNGNDVQGSVYVNAHATSTLLGDKAEYLAIKKSVGHKDAVYISSNKGAIGHLLGAAGAVESIFTIKSLETGQFPHTLNLKNLDPIFQKNNGPLQFIMNKPYSNDNIKFALCNSFGFGGVNMSILFKKMQ